MTGVSLIGGKFLVIRGLGERYSNALLNGAEMPNPVVEKKIPPMDLFPAKLIDALVATKTATPDRPGDFAGGSVEITTKDFPETSVAQVAITGEYNSQASFQQLQLAPRGGTDFLAIDDGRRRAPAIPFNQPDVFKRAAVLQGFGYNVWDPSSRFVAPNFGLDLSLGDQVQGEKNAFGYIAALSYKNRAVYSPDRVYNIYFQGQQGSALVDWGGIVNLSWRLGQGTKLGLKNIYTRSADETTLSAAGTQEASDVFERVYQVSYVERWLWQSQLTGDHRLHLLIPSTVAWKATVGQAQVDNLDNHSAKYQTDINFGGTSLTALHQVRLLHDNIGSGQLDWSFPFSLRGPQDALFKLGGLYRARVRDYQASDVLVLPSAQAGTVTGLSQVDFGAMAPEQAFAPENLGSYWEWRGSDNNNDPYKTDDRLGAAYGMLDFPILRPVRVVGGVRFEKWDFVLKPGGDNPMGDFIARGRTIERHDLDPLWSVNLTYALTNTMNLRAAAYRTLARPDAREISPGQYTPIGGLGSCSEVGDSTIERSLINNYDLRWEMYPRPGELFAVSGFFKYFQRPIIEIRTTGSVVGNTAQCITKNGDNAKLGGLEFEGRRALDFLPGFLSNLSLGANLTLTQSAIEIPQGLGIGSREFIGESPYLINGMLGYASPKGGATFSLLYNYYADRLVKYSNRNVPNQTTPEPNPNWVEQGRGQLDAKLGLRIGARLGLTLSGKNLTGSSVKVVEDAAPGRLVEQYNPGLTIGTSVSYDF